MNEYFEKLSAERCVDLDAGNTVDITRIFGERTTGIMEQNLYIARFRRVPNWISLEEIDCEKANDWFGQNYRDKIIDCVYTKYFKKRKEIPVNRTYYFLFDDLLVYFYPNANFIRLLYRKTDNALVEKLANELGRFKEKKRKKPEIKLLVNTHHGLSTKSMEISKPKFIIEDNYNDDFMPVHKTILNRLQKKKDKGLVLLHGKPGTGKTNYIRYLITSIKKKVIFLPPNLASCVTDPGLMTLLIDYPNSVLVIEDAENIVIDRNQTGSSSVSALLNLADGLLSDCLNIQIICSFNTDISHVDSALTRKGRLIAKYEFGELSTAKAQALSDKLGYSSVINTPMTLTTIYNQDEMELAPKPLKQVMGFAVAV